MIAVEPIKVLKFLTKFAVGGTERQFVNVTKGLDRSRFDVRVGCLSREGEFLKDINALNVPVSEYKINSLYSPQMLRGQWRLARDLRKDGVRLLHAYGFYPNVFSVPAARIAGCISIASVRDTGVFSSKVRLKTLSQKTACRWAHRVIANSSAVRDWLLNLGIAEDHIQIIPNGIHVPNKVTQPQEFPIRREFGINPRSPLVAVVCRLIAGKGVEYFLRAAAGVADRFPQARFLVVGGSDFDLKYRQTLEELAATLDVNGRVIFTGERHDVTALLREIDLFVLPSLSEGSSNALLEAMAAGIPVVATNVGGNPEIVQDGRTGVLVPARDPVALSQAIIRVLECPELARQLGRAGYERAAKHFSIESAVRCTEDLYTSLLDRT